MLYYDLQTHTIGWITMQDHKKDNIFIISAASDVDKTTLVSRLLKNHNDIRVSVSRTIRQPREGEVYSVYYHFVPEDEFESLIEQRAFLEHINVPSNYYGTSIVGVSSLSEEGYDMISETDAQDAAQVRKSLSEASSIFILPSSSEVLAQRLISRGTGGERAIQTCLSRVHCEIKQSVLSDYVVVNDDLDRAEADLFHIVKADRLKESAQ